MQPTLRRLFATIPDAAAVARTASTPRAVRLRRHRKRPGLKPGESDATPSGLTPTEQATYNRLHATGELLEESGAIPSEEEWLERVNARRSRIRGTRELLAEGGEQETRVVGQKVYLPNIIFRLMRNHTLAGQPYNPYEATFRIPQSVTKTDVRSYLESVYGVKTTYIRTDNYLSPVTRDPADKSFTNTKSYRTYKRAVVGLVEPFYYPQAMEDMSAADRAAREKWLEETFGMQLLAEAQKTELLRITKSSGDRTWKWRSAGATAHRGKILHTIMERRVAREKAIEETKARIQANRQNGDAVVEA